MKKLNLLSLIALLSLTQLTYGQETKQIQTIRLIVEYDNANNDKNLKGLVDEPPSYKGGMEKIEQYLTTNLKYSKKDYKMGLYGKNYFELKVSTDSKVIFANCLKATVSTQVINKIQKLLMNCNEWTPAMKNGNAVESVFLISITFESNI